MNRFICIADRRLLMMFSVNVTATAQVAAAAFATVEPSAYSSKRARLTSAGAGTAAVYDSDAGGPDSEWARTAGGVDGTTRK